ncbi:MAG: hypothetical protein IPP40_08840 [bacterium]|nr:hypothetical protein [bacterium]
MLEVAHPWKDAQFAVYDESWPKTDKTKLLSLAKLKADEEHTHAVLRAGLKILTGTGMNFGRSAKRGACNRTDGACNSSCSTRPIMPDSWGV